MSESWPAELVVRPLTAADAQKISEWRYDGPWHVYDTPEFQADPSYLAVTGDGRLLGFCCSGVEATVPGLPADPEVLDVGVGMDPALVGQGHGVQFATAVLDYYRGTTSAVRLRVVVQEWNERSLRLTKALGFTPAGEHTCMQDDKPVTYRIMVSQ